MRPPIVGLVRPAGHGEDSEQPPNDDDNNYDDHLLVASEAGDRVSPLMVSAGHSRPPSRSSSVDSGKGGRQRRRSHRQRTSSARSFMSGNGNAAVLKAAASSTVAAVPIRRGSGNPEFDREWSELHASVAMALTQLEGYIVQLEAHSRAETSETLTPALQRSAVTLVARLNIDIIRLARMTDEQLDVDLYDGSRMDLLGDGNGDVGDWLSWRLVEKKHREMRLTKAFKEGVTRLQLVQRQIGDRVKTFVARARAASLTVRRRQSEQPAEDYERHLVKQSPRLMRGNEEDEEDNAEVDNQLLDESVVPAKPECLTQPDTLVNLAEQDLLKLAEHDLAQCERLIDERESELKDTELSLLEVANVSLAMDRLCTELEKSTAIAIGLVESRRASAVNTKRDELLRMDLTDSKDKDKQSRGGSSFDPGYGSTLLLLGGVVLCVWLFGK